MDARLRWAGVHNNIVTSSCNVHTGSCEAVAYDRYDVQIFKLTGCLQLSLPDKIETRCIIAIVDK